MLIALGNSGCSLFRSGHLNITASVASDFEAGRAFYDEGNYPEAEVRFKNALAADSRAVLIKYWLGLAYYRQNKISDARRQFLQITSLSRSLPHGHHGMGLVALKGKHRKFEALQHFRNAIKRDPTFVDAHWELATTRLSLTRGLFGAFAIGDIRRDLLRVTELAPEHPDAFYVLGKTYYTYGDLDDAERGIPLFEQQIRVRSDHHEARFQLGLAYIDVDRIDEGITTLEHIRNINPDWTEKIDQAVTEARLRNALIRADSIFIQLENLPEKERSLYYDLSLVGPAENSVVMTETPLSDAKARAFTYWKTQDPTPADTDNSRLVEHVRRIAYARRHFGRGIWPWDRRGEVFIRYGEPSDRETYLADATTTPEGTATAQFGIRQVEKWVYEIPPLSFEFVDQGANYIFDAPLTSATGDISAVAENAIYNQDALFDEMAARTPSVYSDEIKNGPPLRFSYSLAVFRDENGQPELEIDYAVPASNLAFEGQDATLATAVVLFGEDWEEIRKVEEEKTIKGMTDVNRRYQVAMYRRTLTVPAGQHHFALHITDAQNGRSGISRQPLEVSGFDPSELAMSDVRLSSSIEPASSGPFLRGGRRLIPNPSGVFSPTRPLMLYFEIYNLQQDKDGRTDLTIEYKVYPLSGGDRPIVAAAGTQVIQEEDGREFSLMQEEDGIESDLQRDIAIDMSQAEPGRYALQVTVNDRHRNMSVEKTVLFRLVND